ncbi:hypothetical protein TCE0_039f12734 [Talaromyces pinophilus]|uniref:MEI5 protein n=1 Tax=Talaromyces pinophilus TaxID=128442 RepID=A0A6N4SL06_TALPI|nr:hypothetical protein TCE0_039f12734 [Talaromyces pinophilus]
MATNSIDIQNNGFQSLKALVTAVISLTHDTSFQYASAVVEEDARLRKQIESQNAEVTRLIGREKELEAIKETTYREMFDFNEREKLKNAEARKEIERLTTKIQENEQKIAELNTKTNALEKKVQDAQRLYDKEKDKIIQANKDITKFQKIIKDKEKLVDELRSEASKTERAFETLQTKHKELKTDKSRIEQEIKQKASRLGELNGYAVEFNEDTELVLSDKIFDLWEFCSNAIAVLLRKDIPMDQFKDPQALKKLKMPISMSHQVPLPPSNTNAAKEMRLAVFLGLLARELVELIFQPCYISLNELDIRNVLLEVAMTDSKKESYYRAILLAMGSNKQKTVLEERKKTFLQNVEANLSDLLPEAQYTELRQILEVVVEKACETWKFFQYSRNRYELDFDLLEWGGDWDPFPFQSSSNLGQEQSPNGDADEPVLAIFPRICRVGNGEFKPLNFGTVLTRYQCADADRELRKKEPSNPRAARAISDRQRTRGISISLGGPSTQNGSFLGDANQASK